MELPVLTKGMIEMRYKPQHLSIVEVTAKKFRAKKLINFEDGNENMSSLIIQRIE